MITYEMLELLLYLLINSGKIKIVYIWMVSAIYKITVRK